MGWITDLAIAIFVIIIGFYALFRLGITLPMVETDIKHFFGVGMVFGFASNAKHRAKVETHKILKKRNIFGRFLRRTEKEAKEEINEEHN